MGAGAEPADSVALKCCSVITLRVRGSVCFLIGRQVESFRPAPRRHRAVPAAAWRGRRDSTRPSRTAPPCMTVRVCSTCRALRAPRLCNLRHQKQEILANLLQSVRKTLNEEEAYLRCLKADLNLPSFTLCRFSVGDPRTIVSASLEIHLLSFSFA